jgi:hypothetical protein
MTADDLNASIPMPPDTWCLDFELSHARAGGFGDHRVQAAQALNGPAFTLIHRGRIAAIWGLVIPWRGLAEGWMVTNPEVIRPIALPFTRGAIRFCDLAHSALGVRRLQVHVQTSNASFMMWARAARFAVEATLPCYLPDGAEVVLMAKVWR